MAAKAFPLGFEDETQFGEAIARLRSAAGVPDSIIGVRGSAATGESASTGELFGDSSDIDFFLVSDTLMEYALTQGARESNGTLRVGATRRYFPSLHQAERELSTRINRKVTVRLFSSAGYHLIGAETDIIGG